MARLRNLLRDHAPFLVIAPLLILVMTYPAITYIFDASRFRAPAVGGDIWLMFWDAWHFKLILAGEANFYHTSLLLYPEGLSLAFHSYNLPHMIVMNILGLFLPPSNAHSLAFLLNIFSCCAAGYIYCLYLFKDKWLALAGAFIFGLSQPVMGKAMEPTSVIAFIPLTLYFLHRGLDEGRTRFFAIAGLLFGFTALSALYIFVFLSLIIAFFVLLFAKSNWKESTFWRNLALMGALALVISAGRLLPMIQASGDLDQAVQRLSRQEKGSDLIGYIYNSRHPVLTPHLDFIAGIEVEPPSPQRRVNVHGEDLRVYVGVAVLALIAFGLLRKSSRKSMLPWLLIAAFFMILRLGPELKINGVVYEDIALPKHYLNQLLPMVFAAFYRPDHFHIGALLPLAILACAGLRALLRAVPANRRVLMILGAIAFIAFETYILPYDQEVPPAKLEYAEWLAARETPGTGALIELPMTPIDFPLLAERMQRQTIHGLPTLGGYLSRISPSAYDYQKANPLLSAWRRGQGVVCGPASRSEISAALEQLDADGFRYVALHKGQPNTAPILASLAQIQPLFANAYTYIYALSQLAEYCADPPAGTESLALYLELVSGKVIPPRAEAIVTFHPSEKMNEDALRYLSWNNDFGQNLNHVTVGASGRLSLQSTNSQIETIDDLAADEASLLFLRDPAASDVEGSAAFADLLASHYQLCGRIAETDHIAIDYYLRHELPCELVFAADKMRVRYDNGSLLLNRAFDIDGGDLRLHLWWQIADGPKTSYSIQVFDAAGERVSQVDSVMNQTMLSHALDLTGMPPGDYQARLIVYDFETGKSYGGEIVADSKRFSRDIEIARFRLDG